jgi:trk system potassium uptake protein
MRIIVIGAGDVGYDIARLLSAEVHDVTIIDQDAGRLQGVQDRLDVRTVQGSGTAADVLAGAGAAKADLLIAVTAVDEVNLIACMLADRMGTRTTIARVRSSEFTRMKSVLQPKDFGIGHVIHPEESAAGEIVRLVRRASATDVQPFAGGRAQLLGLRITASSPVVNLTLQEITSRIPHGHFRVVGIVRGMRTILPKGGETLRKGDHIFILGFSEEMQKIVAGFVAEDHRLIDIMILGGGRVGSRVALHLSREKNRRIKVIEASRPRAEKLAEMLGNALVIHGDPTDVDLLTVEGIGEMDAVLAVTDDEESNLVMCLLAKHLGVKKTVALLSKPAYVPIGERIGLDAAVNVKQSVAREVLRFLRGENVMSVATVHGLDAEALEMTVPADSPLVGQRLMDVPLPDGILFGLIASASHLEVARGDSIIRAGDDVTAFVLPRRLADLRRLMQGG